MPETYIEYRISFIRATGDFTPDGWLAIFAPDERTARRVLEEKMGKGRYYIHKYDPKYRAYWEKFHPAGEQGRWSVAIHPQGQPCT